jgi:hypothetical protein
MPAYPKDVHRSIMLAPELRQLLGGISERTMRRWLKTPDKLPPRPAWAVRANWLQWRRRDVEAWLAQQQPATEQQPPTAEQR